MVIKRSINTTKSAFLEIRSFQLVCFLWNLVQKIRFSVKFWIALLNSLKLRIGDEISIGEVLFTAKGDTVETVQLMRVFGHIVGGEIQFNSPALHVKKYVEAMIFPNSDFIVVNDNAIWHKFNYHHFDKVVPLDKNLVKFNKEFLFIEKPKSLVIINSGFSLCGVHATVWSHFIVQFLPKTNYIKQIIDATNEDLTVIIPQYNDPHIKDILSYILKPIDRISILELKEGEAVKCKKLYHIQSTTILSDHTNFINPSDVILPGIVLTFLKEKVVCNEFLTPSKGMNEVKPFRKLYIKREVSALSPLSGMRVLLNNTEVEDFFISEGFELIEPHALSLHEKIRLFSEASFIVGPYSSGFMNVVFCQPNTNLLVFTNVQRMYELYLSTLSVAFGLNLFALTGDDVQPNNIHSSYSIPLKKIISSYRSFN